MLSMQQQIDKFVRVTYRDNENKTRRNGVKTLGPNSQAAVAPETKAAVFEM
jgi:hypothetical protein